MKKIKKDIYTTVEGTDLTAKEKFFSMIILNNLYHTQLHMLREDPKTHGYVHRHRDYFRGVVGDKADGLLSKLSEVGLIKINDTYSQDRFTKAYKPMFLCSGAYTTVNEIKYLTSKELSNWRGRELKMKEKYKKANWHLKNLHSTLELDIKMLKTLYKFSLGIDLKAKNHKDILIELMNLDVVFTDKKKEALHFKSIELLDLTNTDIKIGEKSKRHYHALSNAPKALRMCLKSKDPKRPYLLELDIKNSQPTILLGLCNLDKLEVEDFVSGAIQRGEFYELVGESWGYSREQVTTNHEIRAEVKEKVFKYLFFATSFSNDVFKAFEIKLPKFAKAIKTLANKDKDKTLACQLQQKESEIMLPITKAFRGIGIHDSVIIACVKDSEEGFQIEDKIKAEFKKLGVRVRVDSRAVQPLSQTELIETVTQIKFKDIF